MKTEANELLLEFHPVPPMFLCEQQQEEARWKESDTHTASTDFGCETLPTTVLTHIKTDDP